MGPTGERSSDTHHVQSNIFYTGVNCLNKEVENHICNDSRAILSGIWALCPGDQTFLSEEHSKEFANATWNTSGKEFASDGVAAAYFARTIYFICSSLKSCVWLFVQAVTNCSNSLHAREVFQKWNWWKHFSEIPWPVKDWVTLPYFHLKGYDLKKNDLDHFVDEFDSQHDNRRIKFHCVDVDMKFWRRLCRDL